jgi:putative membrane protein
LAFDSGRGRPAWFAPASFPNHLETKEETLRSLATISVAAMLIAGVATAQTTNPGPAGSTMPPASPGTGSPTGSSNNAVNPTGNAPSNATTSGTTNIVAASALEKGSNSFTEAQARSRLEGAGLSNVTDLKKDDQGIWRGKASRSGKSVNVGFDYKGNIAAE